MNTRRSFRSLRFPILSVIYSQTHLSKLPRYFLPTPILPSLTSMHGRSLNRFAPRSVTAEHRPPFFM